MSALTPEPRPGIAGLYDLLSHARTLADGIHHLEGENERQREALIEAIDKALSPVAETPGLENVQAVLVVSIVHLSRQAREWIHYYRELFGSGSAVTRSGYFLRVPSDVENFLAIRRPPLGIKAVLWRAQALGCACVLLDRDAPTIADLKTYD